MLMEGPKDLGFQCKWCFEFKLVPLQDLAQSGLEQASQDFQTRMRQVRLTSQGGGIQSYPWKPQER